MFPDLPVVDSDESLFALPLDGFSVKDVADHLMAAAAQSLFFNSTLIFVSVTKCNLMFVWTVQEEVNRSPLVLT